MKKYIFAALSAMTLLTACKPVDGESAAVNANAELPMASITAMSMIEKTEETSETVSETALETAEITETSAETEETASETEKTASETAEIMETYAETAEITETSAETVETSEKKTVTEAEAETSAAVSARTADVQPTYIDGILVVNKTYALPADYGDGIVPEAQEAFDKMQSAAAEEGLNIYISSGFRSYDYQAGLYQRYVDRDGQAEADRYSARPGHSEHQTGLAFDLNSIDISFADTDEGKWVSEHCAEYGFIIRYPSDKEEITGYKYEPWHIRYLGEETACAVYDSGLCLEEYLGIDSAYE